MNWKETGLIFLGLLIFATGFSLGGLDWSWMSGGHANQVAFWAMLGGWVSGLATLAAVAVSMIVAYQASQAGVEKLRLFFSHIYINNSVEKHQTLTELDCVNIKVINERNVTAQIVRIYMVIDNIAPLDIGFMKHGGHGIPHTLEKVGSVWEFAFSLQNLNRIENALLYFKRIGNPKFETGFFVIETTMKQYRLKMTKDLLKILHKCYQKV